MESIFILISCGVLAFVIFVIALAFLDGYFDPETKNNTPPIPYMTSPLLAHSKMEEQYKGMSADTARILSKNSEAKPPENFDENRIEADYSHCKKWMFNSCCAGNNECVLIYKRVHDVCIQKLEREGFKVEKLMKYGNYEHTKITWH